MRYAAIVEGEVVGTFEAEADALAQGGIAFPVDDMMVGAKLIPDGDGVIIDPAWAAARAWEALRAERDRRLLACDWTQLADVSSATAEAWAPYRQALRDLPEATVDPLSPVWPEPPTL